MAKFIPLMLRLISRRFILLPFLFAFVQSNGQGDLLITPKRLVFDGTKRMEEINLANTGKDTATYAISFVQYKMDEEGKFLPVTEDDSSQRFAHKNLRFYPRTVTLAPNEAQSIKVQVLRVNELAPGEYRSHLYFRSTDDKKPKAAQTVASSDSGISIQLTPVFGITIPMIIRNGATEVTGEFANANLSWDDRQVPVLNISLLRKGNISLYGDITVNHTAPNGKVSKVGFVRGMAVYVPNDKRNLHLPLDAGAGINLKAGKLSVVYSDQSPKSLKICEAEISL